MGGDMRMLYCGEALRERGYDTSLYGFDTYETSLPFAEAINDATTLIFPIPMMKGEALNLPFSDERITFTALISLLPSVSGVKAFGGMIPEEIRAALKEKGYEVTDLCENETFNYLNAIPTAEGALSLAISHTKKTLFGSNSVVIGYGRIGRVLSRDLKALGANVTVIARKEKDRAEAESEGLRARDYRYLSSACALSDIIFNTVPSTVLTDDSLSKIPKDTPIIELASKPGGVDTVASLKYGTKVISAQSLPGRVAPISAGEIIARCVRSTIEGGLL